MIRGETLPKYFAIAGRKQHGKDTLARYICKHNSDFVVTHYADPLKKMVGQIFWVSKILLITPHLKEYRFSDPFNMDDFIPKMKDETGIDIQPRNLIAYSPRELMQYFGTEYVRNVQNDYWIKLTIDNILASNKDTLVADVRFPNEAEAIREIGGKVILVNRVDFPKKENEHISEKQVDNIIPDIVCNFKTNDWNFINEEARKIAMGVYDATK